MKEIQEILSRIEAEHQIEILYACESGSRAWGFSSKESDYDIRFIYRPRDWKYYLRIDSDQQRDVIDFNAEDNLYDFTGLELKKCLKLVQKTNPSLVEWMLSPITYRVHPVHGEAIRALILKHYNPIASQFHYYNMAKNNIRFIKDGPIVRAKKYLYVLRPLMALYWIKTHSKETIPVNYRELIKLSSVPNEVQTRLFALVERKEKGEELEEEPRDPILDEFIKQELKKPNADTSVETVSFDELNDFFLKVILT